MSTPTVTELHPPLQATDHDTFADDLEPRPVRKMRAIKGDSTRTRAARIKSRETRNPIGFHPGPYVDAGNGRKRSIAGAS